jgi:hypothetical protein
MMRISAMGRKSTEDRGGVEGGRAERVTTVTVLLDPSSALDVAAMVIDGVDLSPGASVPSDGDPRIDHALRGFLFTCGPEHIRHPEPLGAGTRGMYPLHGSLAGTKVEPATMNATDHACAATFDVALADGGLARLSRRWSIDPETMVIRLEDLIENVGDRPFAPMWMYHVNIAGRHLNDWTRLSGDMMPETSLAWRFGSGDSAHVCLPVKGRPTGNGIGDRASPDLGAAPVSGAGREDGTGPGTGAVVVPGTGGEIGTSIGDGAGTGPLTGEEMADAADMTAWTSVRLGPLAAIEGRSLEVSFKIDRLPYLQLWRCQRGDADVLSIEPVSHRIAKRPDLDTAGELPLLSPGKTRTYALSIAIVDAS